MICIGALHYFIETVLYGLNREQHVVITTRDNDFVFNSPDMDMVVENMYLSEEGNINCGLVYDVLNGEGFSSKPKQEKARVVKDLLQSLVKNDESIETEFEVDLFLAVFEAKDTYWDVKEKERKHLIEKYKDMGNKFFKQGCPHQALRLYKAGAEVYSKYNYIAMEDKQEKERVKPLKISCLLNMATVYFKIEKYDKMSESLEEAYDMDNKYAKTILKRANLNISLGKLEKAKEDLKTVKELDENFPGLRHEIKRLKEVNEIGQKKTQKKFSGFLNNENNKDVLATPESRAAPPKNKNKSKSKGAIKEAVGGEAEGEKPLIDFSNTDPKDWAKKAQEFYGLNDLDLSSVKAEE